MRQQRKLEYWVGIRFMGYTVNFIRYIMVLWLGEKCFCFLEIHIQASGVKCHDNLQFTLKIFWPPKWTSTYGKILSIVKSRWWFIILLSLVFWVFENFYTKSQKVKWKYTKILCFTYQMGKDQKSDKIQCLARMRGKKCA